MTPAEIILHKNLVSSNPDMNSAEWMKIKTGIRDRAFFSSRVESMRFLQTCRDKIAEMLDNAKSENGAITSRAQVVSAIMQEARRSGIAEGTERITDPGSMARANVIIYTNAGMAAGYASAIEANSYGARLAFPAQELVRIEEREVPRDWRRIWTQHGGRLFGGRMIALKEDPIWAAISRFGTPYPPFDFNSGMGVDDISFDEAVSLGVITDSYQPQKDSPLKDFNRSLEADCSFKNDASFRVLKRQFGDQIREANGKIVWRHDIIKEAFAKNRHFEIELGEPSKRLKAMLPNEGIAKALGDKTFTVDGKWLRRKRNRGVNHYDHFEPNENDPRNVPLTVDDLALIPSIWREPDKVEKGETETSIICTMFDGSKGVYRLCVDVKKDVRVKTFYKNTVEAYEATKKP